MKTNARVRLAGCGLPGRIRRTGHRHDTAVALVQFDNGSIEWVQTELLQRNPY